MKLITVAVRRWSCIHQPTTGIATVGGGTFDLQGREKRFAVKVVYLTVNNWSLARVRKAVAKSDIQRLLVVAAVAEL